MRTRRNHPIGPRPAHAGTVRSPAFKRWFGRSVLVNENGEPMVFLHGTSADFTVFQQQGKTSLRPLGYWFADSPDDAEAFGDRLMPVYLRVERPFYATLPEMQEQAYADRTWAGRFRKELEAKGYDGIVIRPRFEQVGRFRLRDSMMVVVFDPRQVKSAIGNVGTFDPSDPDILRNNPSSYRAEIVEMLRKMPSAWRRQYRIGRDTLSHNGGPVLPDAPTPEQAMQIIANRAGGAVDTDKPSGDQTVPAAVRDAAMKGLRLSYKHNYGGWEFFGIARAIQLALMPAVPMRTRERMQRYLEDHAKDKSGRNFGNDAAPSNGYMAWLNWGGDPAVAWNSRDGIKRASYGKAASPRSNPAVKVAYDSEEGELVVPAGHAVRLTKLARMGSAPERVARLSALVPERETHAFALHPANWARTFASLTGKDRNKVMAYKPEAIALTPDTLVGEMKLASRYLWHGDEAEALAYRDSVRRLEDTDIEVYQQPELLVPRRNPAGGLMARRNSGFNADLNATFRDDNMDSPVRGYSGARLADLGPNARKLVEKQRAFVVAAADRINEAVAKAGKNYTDAIGCVVAAYANVYAANRMAYDFRKRGKSTYDYALDNFLIFPTKDEAAVSEILTAQRTMGLSLWSRLESAFNENDRRFPRALNDVLGRHLGYDPAKYRAGIPKAVAELAGTPDLRRPIIATLLTLRK